VFEVLGCRIEQLRPIRAPRLLGKSIFTHRDGVEWLVSPSSSVVMCEEDHFSIKIMGGRSRWLRELVRISNVSFFVSSTFCDVPVVAWAPALITISRQCISSCILCMSPSQSSPCKSSLALMPIDEPTEK
jgi:hypothetical protein